jgi:hypothetical protein
MEIKGWKEKSYVYEAPLKVKSQEKNKSYKAGNKSNSSKPSRVGYPARGPAIKLTKMIADTK